MLKESDTTRYSIRRTHRTYTREFKAELVAACQQPRISIAALANRHGMNANVLHRWLKEHERSGCHQLIEAGQPSAPVATAPVQAFIPLKLPTVMHAPAPTEVKIQLRKGALSMTVTWPLSAADDFAQWTTAILK